MNTLIDSYGRVHRNLRVSLTDRCNLRCTYCMPHDFAAWLPSEHQLTTDELVRVIEIAEREGINEVRLTGESRFFAQILLKLFRASTQLQMHQL